MGVCRVEKYGKTFCDLHGWPTDPSIFHLGLQITQKITRNMGANYAHIQIRIMVVTTELIPDLPFDQDPLRSCLVLYLGEENL